MKKLIAIIGYCMLLACCIYAQELSNDELLSIANSFWAQMNDSNINPAPPRHVHPPCCNLRKHFSPSQVYQRVMEN